MNIYLFSRKDNIGYDETSSLVIIADDTITAKELIKNTTSYGDEGMSVWNDMEPELVGTAFDETPRILCRNFNAG